MLKHVGAVAAIIGASALPIPQPVHADVTLLSADGVLSDSTHAMFIGGTFEPTPSVDWVNAAENYLDPLGFAGPAASTTTLCDMSGTDPCSAPLQVLTTPELLEEGPSTTIDVGDIVKAVEAEYSAGNMSAGDPLTIFTYSQSAMAMSVAEQQLAAAGIPQDDLRLVMIGDPSTANGVGVNIYQDLVQLFGGGTNGTNSANALLYLVNEGQFAPAGTTSDGHALIGAGTENIVTPDNLYPTTVYTIDTDGVGDWQEDWNAALAADNGNAWDALSNALYHFLTTHIQYLGMTPAEIADQTSTVDNLTTNITITDPTDWTSSWSTGLGDIMGTGGFWQSITESLQDIFNPAYA